MSRVIAFVYGVVAYLIFFGTFLYAAGFVGNVGVPKTLDGTPVGPFGTSLMIDLGLLALFAVQHSVMARPAFKRVWTRIVSEPVERSTYVLASSLALILLFSLWRPLGGVVWDVQHSVGRALLHAAFVFGWLLVLVSTFLINHFDLFGLRQVWLHLRGRPYRPLPFRTPGPYRLVRHPLYVGWLFAFWSTPTMTVTHLLFAVMTTAYILVAIWFEERDLVAAHPEYATYRTRVPMLIPVPRRNASRTNQAQGDVARLSATVRKEMEMSRLKMLVTGLVVLSAVAVANRVSAETTLTPEELQRRVEKDAPPHPTLPGKVLCSCPQTGYLSRAVGYLNSFVDDHFTYTTVDVWCVYEGFLPDGRPAFQSACADYRLLK